MSRNAKNPLPGPTTVRCGGTMIDPFRKDEGGRDGTKRTPRVGEASRLFGRPEGTVGRRSTYWLVEEHGRVRPEVLVSRLADGRRVLPVFGFEEEADLFVRLDLRGGRNVRQTGSDELVSLLRGPLGDVELVALDPLSDTEADMLNRSTSLNRREFLEFLAGPTQGPRPTGRTSPGSSARKDSKGRGS